MNSILRSAVAVVVTGSLTLSLAAEGSIGMVTSASSFSLNSSLVKRSATLLEGSRVSTTSAPTQLVLNGGSVVDLGANTSGQVFRGKLRLDSGAARLDKAGAFAIETATVVVEPVNPASKVDIRIGNRNQVGVNVSAGEARVRNRQGVEVARLFPGDALTFALPDPSFGPLPAPQAGASSAIKLSGCVEKVTVDGKTYYFLTDSTTKTKVQLQGTDVEKLANKVVSLEGSPNTTMTPVRGATQVVQVVTVTSQKTMAGCPVAGGFFSRVGPLPLVLLGGLVIGGGTVAGLAIAGARAFHNSSSALAGGQVSIP